MTVRETRIMPLSVTYHGDTAIAVMDYYIDWSGPSGELPSDFRVIDTLRREDGQWSVIARISELRKSAD